MNANIPNLYGFNKTSEAGVNVFAPSVFVQGCNLQCPFCFNAVLAKSKMAKEDIVPLESVDAFIEKESPEMIMISGGEPLMLKNLVNLVDHFIEKGMKIGLSTHGIFPERLHKLLPKLNYVALDIKSDKPEVYEFLDLIKKNNSFDKMMLSKTLLQREGSRRKDFDFETRTTLYPPYVSVETIKSIGRMMSNDDRWILQQYRPTKNLYDMNVTSGVEPYSYNALVEMLDVAKTFTKEAQLRYV
jgi:pyruvate formate lyase activating enzyme